MWKWYANGFHVLRDEANPDGGGGGNTATTTTTDNKDKVIEELKSRLEAMEKKLKPPEDDPDLSDKVKKEQEQKDKQAADKKSLERALKFTMGSKDWLKNNQALLPKTVAGVFAQADKETYGSEVEKANDIMVSIVQEFFAEQANLDLLTDDQKSALEDFRKLTKNIKQERVGNIYSMIFEPTLETLRKIEKAKQLRDGGAEQTNDTKAYVDRMHNLAKEHYLGVTKHGS